MCVGGWGVGGALPTGHSGSDRRSSAADGPHLVGRGGVVTLLTARPKAFDRLSAGGGGGGRGGGGTGELPHDAELRCEELVVLVRVVVGVLDPERVHAFGEAQGLLEPGGSAR